MSALDVVRLVVEVAVVLLLLYLAFLKSYFHEKGKNLATKEDIEEITSKVESVKSQLQYSLHARLSLRTEEHNALVDYYAKYSAWLSGIINFSVADISYDSPELLAEIRAELDALERDFDLAESRMELFVENEDILRQKGPLKIETLGLHARAQRITFEIQKSLLRIKQMRVETPPEQQPPRHSELLDRQTELYKTFKDEQRELYKALFPSVVAHRRLISNHIRKLASST